MATGDFMHIFLDHKINYDVERLSLSKRTRIPVLHHSNTPMTEPWAYTSIKKKHPNQLP